MDYQHSILSSFENVKFSNSKILKYLKETKASIQAGSNVSRSKLVDMKDTIVQKPQRREGHRESYSIDTFMSVIL